VFAMRVIATATATVSVAALSSLVAPAPASATDVALNGTYHAASDGQWSKTNGRFEDQASVDATWSVTTTCSDYLDCTGTVHSTQGWSANATYLSGLWRVVRTVENWHECPDGTKSSGQQTFYFWVDSGEPSRLVGFDKTIGPSGACGVNRPLTIEMPFTLTPA
jgi:hypothetical protein